LKNECGYEGPTPYWDFTSHSDDLRKSPVFDGSPTSMGGNGEFDLHAATIVSAFGQDIIVQPGTGGGCVTTGPFIDLVVRRYLSF
jgi:tyrosinase